MELPVKKIAAAGLLATAVFTVAMIVHLSGQQASNVSGDFRNASTAEVRDAAGQVGAEHTSGLEASGPRHRGERGDGARR